MLVLHFATSFPQNAKHNVEKSIHRASGHTFN